MRRKHSSGFGGVMEGHGLNDPRFKAKMVAAAAAATRKGPTTKFKLGVTGAEVPGESLGRVATLRAVAIPIATR